MRRLPSFLLVLFLLFLLGGLLWLARPASACPLPAGCHHPCCRAIEYYWDFYGKRKWIASLLRTVGVDRESHRHFLDSPGMICQMSSHF